MTETRLLKDVAVVQHGGTPNKREARYWDGEIPWISPKDMKVSRLRAAQDHISDEALHRSATRVMPSGTVLVVARSGVLAHSLPVAILECPMAFNQDIKAILPNETLLDSEYLFFFLRSQESEAVYRGVKKGATVHSLRAGYIENLDIPLPPLSEQRRIVNILSRAEGIVRLQKQAADKAREIIPALFIDMFGDPETNPRDLPILSVGDFVKRFEGGKNLQAGSDLEGGFRILKVSAVTSGIYRETENKAAPNDYDPPKNHVVRVSDLLFSRANTKELVGATAIVESSDGRTLLPDKIWRFVWKRDMEPRYVHALFQTPHVRRELSKLSTGTSASMRNISQAKLRSLTVPIADIEEQKVFSAHAESILGISDQQERAMETSEQTFQSLLHRAFTGQL